MEKGGNPGAVMSSLEAFLSSLERMRTTLAEAREQQSTTETYGRGIYFDDSASSDEFNDDEAFDVATDKEDDSWTDQEDDHHRTNENSYDLFHLMQQCTKYVSERGSSLDPSELCDNLTMLITSDTETEELQSALVDVLGYEDLDWISEIVLHKAEFAASLGNSDNSHTPASRKKRNKSQKEAGASDGDLYDRLLSKQDIARQLDENSRRPLTSGTRLIGAAEQYPHIYQTHAAGNTLNAYGSKYALPSGSTREEFKEYEEITVPASRSTKRFPGEKPVLISELDNLCQPTFPGYTSLNRMQSFVYPVAYKTNENMLICAPTGAGKTDVAMLTVLQTIAHHSSPSPLEAPRAERYDIARDDFKIVYVAPMKALAAEIVQKLGKRLAWLGIEVRELTGDMQLTKAEIQRTQIIVTTPEKWDVVTRKSTGDTGLAQKVRLLIIDEVHLLHDDRGGVIETIVARTQRQVEASQSMIRIVGLSATLPNYVDVAEFLKVNPYQGLFYFDQSFRPVPLEQHFLGVKGKAGSRLSQGHIERATYEKVIELVQQDKQVMVFVHARKETVKTGQMLREMAMADGYTDLFDISQHPRYDLARRDISKSKNREMKELFGYGIGIHHAGMLRSDRNISERLFGEGMIKVLCCTATLAWGVNLPAAAVVIKGTQLYDPKKGGFTDLGILDVLQIFGRAGRPQFEQEGKGYIVTSQDKLSHYVSAITQQHPIESRLTEKLVDNLNAEISLGTVTNIDEAVSWLSYTYLYVRMKKNPLVYGMSREEVADDPLLGSKRRELIIWAARKLHKTQMIIFDEHTGILIPKDLGRVASNYYILHTSIETFNQLMKPNMTEADVLAMLSMSDEFAQMKSRDTESKELTQLVESAAPCDVKGTPDTTYGKANILLQSYISRANVEDFALVSDTNYVSQNAGRIARALFEIALNRRWGPAADVLLSVCKSIEKRTWSFQHPLSQFNLPAALVHKLEARSAASAIEEMKLMDADELGDLVHHNRMGKTIANYLNRLPMVTLDVQIAPLTRNVLRVHLEITPDFRWDNQTHGSVEPFWLWVEESDSTEILYSDYLLLSKRKIHEAHKLDFTIPISDPLPSQIYVRAVSDRWLGAESVVPVSFQHLILPEMNPPQTDLLDLQPLPITALHDDALESICAKRFTHFNPVQTQIFHTLYNTDNNVFVGAPTGSGKTIAAELSMWRAFRERPNSKVVYIAPMKALVRERVKDWSTRLMKPMNRKLVELTGDNTPDIRTMRNADVIITTPEKWDGISRSWQSRDYVKQVSLVIIDEIHLLGSDRGPILEIIVSRMKYIAAQRDLSVRVVGLSTAVANAQDLADWLGIRGEGLFNFRHSVRPVPLEIYIDGFPGRNYCPRMASMNKPTFNAIKTHSPTQPVIVFVSSRRQTRLTAQDLIAFCGSEDNPRRFLHMPDDEMDPLLQNVQDSSLKLSLSFGIGLHHAGLPEKDRRLVEELFVNNKIQVLVATSTLAWGVNFPAHLVIVKGTEYYDSKIEGYKDMDLTDVLQMLGRAGRPQFDTSGVARIFVQDTKKSFYKHFLHSGFPVESSLHKVLDDHLGAEIASGTIASAQDALDYLTWTYLFRRVHQNPTYYGVEDVSEEGVSRFLTERIEDSLQALETSGCINREPDGSITSTSLGKIQSWYYISHKTVRHIVSQVTENASFEDCLKLLCGATEYDELPVRHNEDLVNKELSQNLPFKAEKMNLPMWDPHVKAFLLLQAHMSRVDLPITDYLTDTISVLDQSIRVIQACIDIVAELGCLSTTLMFTKVLQSIKQARWPEDGAFAFLPGMRPDCDTDFTRLTPAVRSLKELADLPVSKLQKIAQSLRLPRNTQLDFVKVSSSLPILSVQVGAELDTLRITLTRQTPLYHPKQQAYTPKFPKIQTEGVFIICGDPNRDELYSLKRVSMLSKEKGPSRMTQAKLSIPAECRGLHSTVYVISDAYPGVDSEVSIELGQPAIKTIEVWSLNPGREDPGRESVSFASEGVRIRRVKAGFLSASNICLW
ncbi:hypothetical protein G7K_4564-t1 [Saitoella complicata NRRL Y-17804]|uniref:RNA helicase n=1 Tax=Saitoella complicata (strain BCRC 22490 / CBS 7301 / JCM 7358 / NBRC 10748 / NRRL Y-17804) TaxID=698492 RepID=A0A0E9NKS7_SAICN|nr:hypothetical protein G7K_4564-t1 [Saitoella complicata NRRL Y-17804]